VKYLYETHFFSGEKLLALHQQRVVFIVRAGACGRRMAMVTLR